MDLQHSGLYPNFLVLTVMDHFWFFSQGFRTLRSMDLQHSWLFLKSLVLSDLWILNIPDWFLTIWYCQIHGSLTFRIVFQSFYTLRSMDFQHSWLFCFLTLWYSQIHGSSTFLTASQVKILYNLTTKIFEESDCTEVSHCFVRSRGIMQEHQLYPLSAAPNICICIRM